MIGIIARKTPTCATFAYIVSYCTTFQTIAVVIITPFIVTLLVTYIIVQQIRVTFTQSILKEDTACLSYDFLRLIISYFFHQFLFFIRVAGLPTKVLILIENSMIQAILPFLIRIKSLGALCSLVLTFCSRVITFFTNAVFAKISIQTLLTRISIHAKKTVLNSIVLHPLWQIINKVLSRTIVQIPAHIFHINLSISYSNLTTFTFMIPCFHLSRRSSSLRDCPVRLFNISHADLSCLSTTSGNCVHYIRL